MKSAVKDKTVGAGVGALPVNVSVDVPSRSPALVIVPENAPAVKTSRICPLTSLQLLCANAADSRHAANTSAVASTVTGFPLLVIFFDLHLHTRNCSTKPVIGWGANYIAGRYAIFCRFLSGIYDDLRPRGNGTSEPMGQRR